MFKKMRLVILFDMLLNPSFKMTTGSTNIARTTELNIARVNIVRTKIKEAYKNITKFVLIN